MQSDKGNFIGSYYVRLKEVHINWTHNTGPKRGKEAYIPIPAEYAYAYEITKGTVVSCQCMGTEEIVNLKAAGSQGRREYAKQFQGNNNLRVVYDLYDAHQAVENDYVVVLVFDNNFIQIEIVKQDDVDRVNRLGLHGSKGKPLLNAERGRYQEEGFRLISLSVHRPGNNDCNYQFLPENNNLEYTAPLTSLIVGANGTGKSFALMVISELFVMVQNGEVKDDLSYDSCRLVYILEGSKIEIELANRALLIHRDGVLTEISDKSVLPNKILTIAFMLNDKFPFQSKDNKPENRYEYLGIKTASNAAWINTFNAKVIENVIELASENRLWNLLRAISSFLEIEPKVSISFEYEYARKNFSDLMNMTKEDLTSYLEERANRKSRFSHSYGMGKNPKSEKYAEFDYSQLAEYLQALQSEHLIREDTKEIVFGFAFDENSSVQSIRAIKADYKFIQELIRLRLVKNGSLNLYKNGKCYTFDDSSSGEKNIIYTALNIARYIKKNSIILIDEPEISLHPNWQMLYISFLKKMFADFSSCHFLIATHSPYLVSDLDPASSSVVVLKDENGIRKTETLEYSTYAWSVENILYNVFNARTLRNFYFEMDIRDLLAKISSGIPEELPAVRELTDKLSQYSFSRNDPLNRIIDEAREYIKNAEFNKGN